MKEIQITIKYQISDECYEKLEEYGYDFEKNAEDKAKEQAYHTAAMLKWCENNQDKI